MAMSSLDFMEQYHSQHRWEPVVVTQRRRERAKEAERERPEKTTESLNGRKRME